MVKVNFKNNKLIRTFKHVDDVSNDNVSLLNKRMAFIILFLFADTIAVFLFIDFR